MTVFWILTAAMALGVTALLALAMIRGNRDTGPAEAFDIQVYRDQLSEIDRDLARGTIQAEDAERLRTEVSRRLLAADAKVSAASGKPAANRNRANGVVALLVAAVVIAGSYALYTRTGAPGYGDLPLTDRIAAAREARENRPLQAEVEASLPAEVNPDAPEEYLALVQQLRSTVAERPNDLQGHVLLVRSEAALGNYKAAYEAQQQVIALKGDGAPASDYADLADMMVLAAGGYVSPEAETALEAALNRDPQNGVAQYYMGVMFAQTGRPDGAFRIWDRLLRRSTEADPWVPPIRAQIEEMAVRAGVRYELPDIAAAPRGPSADDVQAAQEMTPEERQDMIRGMVAQLSDRLATEGGTPQEWARLISSLAVLGDTEQAAAVWADAQEVFAETPDALEIVRAGARQAGLEP